MVEVVEFANEEVVINLVASSNYNGGTPPTDNGDTGGLSPTDNGNDNISPSGTDLGDILPV